MILRDPNMRLFRNSQHDFVAGSFTMRKVNV
jgi:hypothetical protein